MGKTVVIMTGVLAIILCVCIYWYNYGSNGIKISSAKLKKKHSSYETAKFSIVSNLGTSSQMRMEVAIPCRDKKQYSDLDQNLPRIKDALLTSIDQEKMTKHIGDRNFDMIKKSYLNVINRFLEKPVDTILITSFNY
jgi:flagellar basal body-associated protein FliL